MALLDYVMGLTGANDAPGQERSFLQRLFNVNPQPIVFSKNVQPQQKQAPVAGVQPTQPQPQALPVQNVQRPSTQPQGTLDVGSYRGGSSTEIPLPSQDVQNLLWQYFPKEATQAAVVLAGENAGFNPNAVNPNNDGTYDYGLFQTNDKTINEMLGKKYFGDALRGYGINRPEDVLGDILKSVQAASLVREYEKAPRFWGDTQGSAPWSRWYGWQNKGYTIDPNRSIQELSSIQGDPYFKLTEFVNRNQ